ncbi:hypothetical protein LBMAG56_27580 [Verrucomicrobiota bacterium]|nr:hypothetical protein LBMAG56_27580 [Verrucomicrobiota bacterium]
MFKNIRLSCQELPHSGNMVLCLVNRRVNEQFGDHCIYGVLWHLDLLEFSQLREGFLSKVRVSIGPEKCAAKLPFAVGVPSVQRLGQRIRLL